MSDERHEVVVVGAGPAGLAQSAALSRAGVHDHVLLEKADELGGTWRDNHYPGCACDVESHLYSYSFAGDPGWRETFAAQPDILAYLRRVAADRRITERIRFGTDVRAAHWDTDRAVWSLRCADGRTVEAGVLVLATGGLHVPNRPELPGEDRFPGRVWHSARWEHDYPLAGKRVAVVGVGASGVQIVPEVAASAASLTVFQRTAAWVLPKPNPPIGRRRRWLLRLLPGLRRLHRARLYLSREKRGIGFTRRPDLLAANEPALRRFIGSQISDPGLRAAVTPDFTFGCRRVLFSDDYYRTLDRPHVDLVRGAPVAFRGNALVDAAGGEHEVDAVVFATGFDLFGTWNRIDVVGPDGDRLAQRWSGHGTHNYRGIAVAGFPNLFVLLGPNSVIPYTSQLLVAEVQARYVARAVRGLRRRGARSMDVHAGAEERFQEFVRTRFPRTVWSPGHCTSWYQTRSRTGTILFPDGVWRYRGQLRHVRFRDYRLDVR